MAVAPKASISGYTSIQSHHWPVLFLVLIVGVATKELFHSDREWLLVLDDGDNFIHNRHIHGLSKTNVEWALRDGTMLGVYEPVGWLLKMGVIELSGYPPSQLAAATASFVLHLLCALLAYSYSVRLLRLLGPWPEVRWSCSVATAIVFVHPQCAEAVAWLSAQGYPLAAAFLLASAHLQLSAFFSLFADAPSEPSTASTTSSLKSWQAVSEAHVDSIEAQLRAMGVGALSLVCFSLGCLSKAAAVSFVAFPAAVEFLLVTSPPSPLSSLSQTLEKRNSWRKVASAVVAVAARQLPALCVAGFVTQRTMNATEAQTTCGFANDYRRLGAGERWIAAGAAPLRHVGKFLHPLGSAIEEYYPKETLFSLPGYVAPAIMSLVLTLWALWRMILRLRVAAGQLENRRRHTGVGQKEAISQLTVCDARDAIAASWLTFVAILAPSLGLFGTGDHLCYINADRYSYIASAALFPSLLAALLLAACSNPANAPLSAQITEENPQDPAKVRKPSAIRATLGILFGFLCALLCFTSAPAFASFRSDVRHYSRVLGWHRNRAFPHYLLGLGHQRAAERSEAKNEPSSFEDSHRQAIKALTAAERFAPGWLNLAAARAESYTALQQHERAATILLSIARARPGVMNGFYDYRLALALEKSAGDKFKHGCVPAALHHYTIAAPLLYQGGDFASGEHAEGRLTTCRRLSDDDYDHQGRPLGDSQSKPLPAHSWGAAQ